MIRIYFDREPFETWVVRKLWLFAEINSCAPLDRDLMQWEQFVTPVVKK